MSSQIASQVPASAATAAAAMPPAPSKSAARSFVAHAKLISFLTLISRILGMARETVVAVYLGDNAVTDAFVLAWKVPNLFRKLFGEGALSAAFIPLYAQALKDGDPKDANRFAAASVTLLCLLLLGVTIVGEIVLWGASFLVTPEQMLVLKLTAIMLPYVLLICGTAFLGAILQVHRRFGLPAAAPFILNIIHIAVVVTGAWLLGLHWRGDPKQNLELKARLVYWLAFFVLLAGVLQVLMLLPALRAVGVRQLWERRFWTVPVRRMLQLSVPVAFSAGVLQLSVLIDGVIPKFLTAGSAASFHLLGWTIRYPVETGAVARLNWAQVLYQFPLGVFAIAIATAIFPSLSADALDADRDRFRQALRQGIYATLLEGFAASMGLILVARPAVRVLFPSLTAHSMDLVVRSTMLYASAIWAYSLQQVINRAYYSLHDTKTPFWMSVVTIVVNTVVEVPLFWTPLTEAGMAAGTCASFTVQAIVMLVMLDRRVGGLGLRQIAFQAAKMLLATAAMGAACLLVQRLPGYPHGHRALGALVQLVLLIGVGAVVYLGLCLLMRVPATDLLLPRALRRRQPK